VLGLNAAKVYKFDLEALAKQAAKSGPTPERWISRSRSPACGTAIVTFSRTG